MYVYVCTCIKVCTYVCVWVRGGCGGRSAPTALNVCVCGVEVVYVYMFDAVCTCVCVCVCMVYGIYVCTYESMYVCMYTMCVVCLCVLCMYVCVPVVVDVWVLGRWRRHVCLGTTMHHNVCVCVCMCLCV